MKGYAGKPSGSDGIAYLMKILSNHKGLAGVRLAWVPTPIDLMCRHYEGGLTDDTVADTACHVRDVRAINAMLDRRGFTVCATEAIRLRADGICDEANLRGMHYQIGSESHGFHVEWEGDELAIWGHDGHVFGPSFLEAISTL
ncbi:hypothetical protein HQ524_00480 [Candidatus Uhrbacteria bacterium]|nr:hypothetical protein [Candidatus Uhrbacteria bacterium]